MFKSLKITIILASVIGALILAGAQTARADTTCGQDTIVNFVANNPGGGFIPNANVTIYKQVIDANGQPKPGGQVASGNTGSIIGIAKLNWRNSLFSDTYVVKVQTVGNDQGSFWYYDNNWSCGQTASLAETLSGIIFSLHDGWGNLLTNTGFNLYSQIYSGGQPLKQLRQSVASPNTGSSGQVAVYLPQGSIRSIDQTLSDVYALDISHSGQKFDLYNIPVTDGALNTVNYFIPALSVHLQDSTGALFPKGTNVDVFKQTVDSNNLRQVGSKIGSFTIGDGGQGLMEAPVGLYVLGIKDKNNNYQYFWDMQVTDGQTNNYNLIATSSPVITPITTTCQNNSQLTLNLRTAGGQVITGLHFALYEEANNANGLPVPGNQVGAGTLDNSGNGILNFRPDPRQAYALKIWDQNSNLGVFWFYSAVRFVCNNDRAITETIPALTIVLRDNQGELLRNYNFSLYAQENDADNHPFFQGSDQIAGLQTSGTGKAVVYVAPYNSYLPSQTGIYAISVKDANGNTENFYNIKISPDKDYSFGSSFSGLKGELRDPEAHILANKNLDLYEEKASDSLFSLGKKLLSVKTDSGGQFSFEYPAGNYALVLTDDFNRPNIFWNLALGSNNTFQKLTTSLTNFSLSDPQGQGLANNAALQLYSLTKSGGVYYRDSQIGTVKLTNNTATMSLAAGPYLAYYAGLGNQSFGQAFYAKNGSSYSVNIALSSKYLVSPTQSFWLSGVPANYAPNTSATPASSQSASSPSTSNLSSSLKGRILLQVEDKGQAWYISPLNGERYSLGRPQDAFNVMRRLALGVSNANFSSIQNNPSAWRNLAGRILLKTADSGKAYYFDPTDLYLYYLGLPQDAFNVMRTRGLGITNSNLGKIKVGE